MTTGHTLTRTVFQTSRVLEFFTDKELTMQIGFPRHQWPLALLKELIDNALDACEMSGHPPDITVTVTEDTVSVQDNGPALLPATLERTLDYLMRVSDKASYVSPTRRQLDEPQRAMVAARLVTLKQGRPEENSHIHPMSQERAADLLHVGVSTVKQARKVQADGAPELAQAVDAGPLTVSAAPHSPPGAISARHARQRL
jgi:hypothetical protein